MPSFSLSNVFFVMVCASFLSACSSEPSGKSVEQRAQALVNATPVSSSTDTSTAALRFWDSDESEWGVGCSGTYLRKDLVLTAAHCVVVDAAYTTLFKSQDLSLKPLPSVEVCAAQSNTNDGTECDWQNVEKMFVAPGYSGDSDHTHDWALIKLTTEAGDGNLRLSDLPSLSHTSVPDQVRIQSAQLDGSFPERIIPS